MDHIWKIVVGFLGFEILELCSSHPVPFHKNGLEGGEVPGALLGMAMLLVSVVCLVACICCRESQRKGFKPDKEESEKEKEFRDSQHSLNHAGLSFTNPGLSPGSELAIFPPPGVSVSFDPLPSGLSPGTVHISKKPSAYRNLPIDSLSDTDWFGSAELDFPRQQLQYLREYGRGWFGRVVEGEARGLSDARYKVMVRILREDATTAEQKFFLNEAKPYRDLNHPNVLKMVGRCLETNPYLILLEACSAGDLKSFLCNNTASSSVLSEQGVCLRIMCQVAAGLQHMINHGFVHTDLATRNCLVSSDLTVKVGDYGTSIDTYKNEYYIAGDVAVPVRWCAPETLHCTATTIETKQVTAEANVWSLGVMLWEICQFGQMPYSELTDDQVIVRVLGREELRLPAPTLHPLHAHALYSVMCLCWRPSGGRASLDHVVSMLSHLQSSNSEEDFQRRWDALRPVTTPEITLETMTARSDFDSGVDLEIKSADREILELVKKSSSDVNLSPSSASPQPSVASSSGGEFFSQTNLAMLKKEQSPSMTNLHGSVEDVSKPLKQDKTLNDTDEFDSWLKGVDTTNEEDVKFVKKISEAIRDLDDALALEKTSSSSDDSSRQESPLKDSSAQDKNPVLDFRLGPLNEVRQQANIQPHTSQDDSLLRRDSSGTDTEDETWRKRIERGEFSEKVKEKSKSVTDLMILTHIESESSESDSLPSLTRQYSETKRKSSGPMMSTIGFGSEGNIRGAVLGEEFQDALKQLQAEWKFRDMESRESSLQFIKNEVHTPQNQDKLDFLSNDASEKRKPQNSLVTKNQPKCDKSPVITSCSSSVSETVLENDPLQKSAVPSNSILLLSDEIKIHKVTDKEESFLRLAGLSPETTDISETSQNTESSSEISTPTQYEVFNSSSENHLFINCEKEHSVSSSLGLLADIPSKTIEKPALNVQETVQIVPNVNSLPNSSISELKSVNINCDTTTSNIEQSEAIAADHASVASVDECVNNPVVISLADVSEWNNHQLSNLLSNSATQKESDVLSDNLVVKSNKNNESNKQTNSHVDSPDFLLQTNINNVTSQVPEIVVTEASMLDVDSDSEPEMFFSNVNRERRSIRIMLSSSDDETEDDDDKVLENISISENPIISKSSIVTSTPFVNGRKVSTEDTVSDVDPTFPDSTSSDSFFVPYTKEKLIPPPSNNETSVILGSCEDYTLDYFQGLKTTFEKQTSDESTDEFSKSEGEEEEIKQQSVNNWDEFISSALQKRYQQENSLNSDVEFGTSDNETDVYEKSKQDHIINDSVDILKNQMKFDDHMSENVRKNIVICDRMDILENLNGKQNFENHDQQMREVKSRLEDVAMLSEGFSLKNQNMTMEDDEDGKLLTPDDERSSDSGFRDKGSLSESVEDACDEKYNLEDIEAELEEQYIKQSDSKFTEDRQNNKIDGENFGLLNDSNSYDNTYIDIDDNKTVSKEDADLTSSTIKPSDSSSENSREMEEQSDDKQERLNRLDHALDSNIDIYFENDSQPKTGWYLHPPPGTSSVQPITNGWLSSGQDECKDNSYSSFDINEEFVTAIRNELKEKLPCAQNPEREDTDEDVSPEEERTDMVIQYNTFPVALSPILEERESISSNQSSLLFDEMGKSLESSGRSSPVLYLDATKEDGYLSKFEDYIRDVLDVNSSESTESDNVLVTVEDLENLRGGKAQKVVENTKDDMDDLLIVDTETNKVTLYESPRPRSQLAFVKQIVEPSDDNMSVNSETFTLHQSTEENMLSVDRNNLTYTPDSISPLSTGSNQTGIAVSFTSPETGDSLSGFYLSPSSVQSDLLDNGPPSLPFDLGQVYDPVEEIKPNNEAEEIMQELVEAGVLKKTDLKGESEIVSSATSCGTSSSKDNSRETTENVCSEETEEQTEESGSSIESPLTRNENSETSDSEDLTSMLKGTFNTNTLKMCSFTPKNSSIISCDRIDKILTSENKQMQPVQENQLECRLSDSQDWLKSVLLSSTNSVPEKNLNGKDSVVEVCINNSGWPSADELITKPFPAVRCESQVTASTPESPNLDLLEVAAKFYDVTSTLAISTPNNTSFDESKDNSQFSSFTSTPTLETAKCIVLPTKSSEKLVHVDKECVLSDGTSIKSLDVPSLSSLASEVLLKLPAVDNEQERHFSSGSSSPDDSERARRLQGMTLALEPSLVSKAPMPSPEDADKGTWRPTMGQLMELTNQPDQEDMMTTSFIDADNNDYAPDWESDTSDDSEEHSSSSGEFVWREGDREEGVRIVVSDDTEPPEGASETSMARISEEEEEEEGGEDNSSCGSTTEFIPSTWDSNATPTKSALRSAEKPKSEKRNVLFKRQKYHCVYEYPREPSDSEEDEELSILQRRTWQSPSTFDYSTYADWEYGEGEVEEAESDSDDNAGDSRQLPESEYDFYRLSNLDFEMMTQMNLDDGEFFISSSARPFQIGDSSQFFPGSIAEDDFLVEFQPSAADTDGLVLPSPNQLSLDDTITGRLREVEKVKDVKVEEVKEEEVKEVEREKQKPSDLCIVAEPLSEADSSAEVSPTLGELRHTRQRLKLDLGRGGVRGEASLLDSGGEGEDSGVESTATGSSDRLDQVQVSDPPLSH